MGRRSTGVCHFSPPLYIFSSLRNSVLIQNPVDIPEPQKTAAGQDLYFEVLELQPIRLTLSFMRTERVSSEDKFVFSLS